MLDFGLFSGFELVTLCPNVAQPCTLLHLHFNELFTSGLSVALQNIFRNGELIKQ